MNQPVICALGVDPGLSGGIAFWFPSNPEAIAAEDMPVVGGAVDAATLAQRIRQMGPTIAVLELAGPRPQQGTSSTFKTGDSFGVVRGVVAALGVPLLIVAPSRWKRHYGCLGKDKELSRALALRYWPASRHFSKKKDHGKAEAALLARWGAETQGSVHATP